MPRDTIITTHEGEEVPFYSKLCDLNIDSFGILTLGLTNSNNLEFKVDDLYKDMAISDIITVHCETPKGDQYDLIVEIEDRRIEKPFTGGYRNKITNIEYHHAFTQTGPPPLKVSPYLLASRNCQTIVGVDRNQQTTCTNATQMYNEHIFVPSVTDKILTPGKYKTYAEVERERDLLTKVAIIKKNFRAYMWIKLIKDTAKEYRRLVALKQEAQKLDDNELAKERKHDIIVQTYPREKKDFLMLQSMIAEWHKKETELIEQKYSGVTKHAELSMLLDKEIKMLQVLYKRKMDALVENTKLEENKIVHLAQKPVTWIGYKGLRIEMDTLKTQHARKLSEIYENIQKDLPVETRLEVLLSLREALQENPTDLAVDLIELLDRESDLLIREFNGNDLKFLRQRIKQLLMKYMKDPNTFSCSRYFNCSTTGNYNLCKYCLRIKPEKMISIYARAKFLNICDSCFTMGQTHRKDYTPFSRMLKEVQFQEQKNNCSGAAAFFMNSVDMQKLVETIWHGKSVLSGSRGRLKAPRWDRKDNWSPWNCIILTREEQVAHNRITDLEKAYDPAFISCVKLKHSLGRNMFKQLAEVEESFVESKEWDTAHCQQKYCEY